MTNDQEKSPKEMVGELVDVYSEAQELAEIVAKTIFMNKNIMVIAVALDILAHPVKLLNPGAMEAGAELAEVVRKGLDQMQSDELKPEEKM